MNENVSYVSPEVEVVKIAIEKGFAASNQGTTPGTPGGVNTDPVGDDDWE